MKDNKKTTKKRTSRAPVIRRFDLAGKEIHRNPNLSTEDHKEQLQDILTSGLLTVQKLACKDVLSLSENRYLKTLLEIYDVLEGKNTKLDVTVTNQYDKLSSVELLELAEKAVGEVKMIGAAKK